MIPHEWTVTKKHILNCKEVFWHEKFRNNTIKSVILPLPLSLVRLISTDGIQVSRSLFPAVEDEWGEKWEEEEVDGVEQSILSNFPEFEKKSREGN